jgi:hypothetical protein
LRKKPKTKGKAGLQRLGPRKAKKKQVKEEEQA